MFRGRYYGRHATSRRYMSKSPLEMFLIVDIVSVSFLVSWHTKQRHFITQGFNLMLRDRQTSARRFAAAIASVAAAAAFSFGVTVAVAPQANAWPGSECTNGEQPYPDSPYDVCTDYHKAASRSTCKYPPGTAGALGHQRGLQALHPPIGVQLDVCSCSVGCGSDLGDRFRCSSHCRGGRAVPQLHRGAPRRTMGHPAG